VTIALTESLQTKFGFSGFREGQEQCVNQLLSGHSSLAIFPTGSGKSLCYQFTAMHLPELTLVVSPLLALIQDQLQFLNSKGIPAASIDSTLSADQYQKVVADVRSGHTKILMVSVERFKNERFRQLIKNIPISMLVIDEAHCISEWGHNFRPDYLKLPQYREELNIPLVLLLTATATKKVKHDMARKFHIVEEHVVQTGFYRSNLALDIVPVNNADKNQCLLNNINQQHGPGIVYVTLQQTAENVADFLKQQGVNAQAYHAGFKSDHRQSIQTGFMAGKIDVVVATIAFGMGVDKSDIRFVIHYDLPKSIENYSQEIGRAGRDGQASNCITLANLDGVNTVENFVFGDTPEREGINVVLQNIQTESNNGQWELQANSLSSASNIRLLTLKTLLVQLEIRGVLTPKFSYFAEFKYKFIDTKENILNQYDGERRAFLEAVFKYSSFKKVWGEVDFLNINQNYPCDRSRIVTALEYLHEKQQIELQTKKMTEVFQVDITALNTRGLLDSFTDYFKENEKKEITRIAALIRFFQLDRCLSNNLSRYFDDYQVPDVCGHCSVCQNRVAHLQQYDVPKWPTDMFLQASVTGLIDHIAAKRGKDPRTVQLSPDLICRFLSGISVPVFTRYRARQLKGFGCCELIRYEQTLKKVVELVG